MFRNVYISRLWIITNCFHNIEEYMNTPYISSKMFIYYHYLWICLYVFLFSSLTFYFPIYDSMFLHFLTYHKCDQINSTTTTNDNMLEHKILETGITLKKRSEKYLLHSFLEAESCQVIWWSSSILRCN